MNIFDTILIAVFFFLMGGAIIGLIWYLRGVSKKIQGKSKSNAPEDPNLSELARLMRHLQTQDLVVEMDGKYFYAAKELSPAQHRRLSFTSNVLAKWLAEVPLEPMQEEAPAATWPEAAPESPGADEDLTAEPSTGYIPPFTAEPAGEDVKPVSTNVPGIVGSILNPTPQPKPEYKSIAMQINDILQEKLVGTPLAARGITLNDAPDRGVMVTLDGKQYPGVMEVPDEAVRKAIRSAVVEWETRK